MDARASRLPALVTGVVAWGLPLVVQSCHQYSDAQNGGYEEVCHQLEVSRVHVDGEDTGWKQNRGIVLKTIHFLSYFNSS